jgi:hypothetical protein
VSTTLSYLYTDKNTRKKVKKVIGDVADKLKTYSKSEPESDETENKEKENKDKE